jgi:DNA-directed RNA polymerase subunit D
MVKKMEVKKIFEEGNISKYLVKGTTPAFMNTLRRTIMNNTPCLAIDTVRIYDNDSVVVDEMLVNRLGLLPLKTDIKGYKKGNTVKLVLDATGPKTVTSKDIKCTDPKIEVTDKKIPITKLGKEQKLKLEMTAIMGTGYEHVKFQPAIVSYNEVPTINNEKAYSNTKELIDAAPKGLIEAKAGKLFLLDPYNIKFATQQEDLLAKHGVKLEYIEDEFVLTIENNGQLSPKEIIELATDSLAEKLEEFGKEIKKI